MTTTQITVSGMTCGHCSAAVTEELQSIQGVSDVTVDLVAGGDSPVTIISEDPLPQAAVEAAVAEAGDYSIRW